VGRGGVTEVTAPVQALSQKKLQWHPSTPQLPGRIGAASLSTAHKHNDLLRRHLAFLLFGAGSIIAFWMPLGKLIEFALAHDYGSHIFFVVPASAYLVYVKRREIFSTVSGDVLFGSLLFFAGLISWWLAGRHVLQGNSLSLVILAIVVIWMSGFVFFYGRRAFAIARFPLLFLLLLVPIPEILIDKIIFLLQSGSAGVAYGLLRLLGVPVFKRGFLLQLPTLDIEVAKECSGIRSSLALFITVLVVGKLVLRSGWRRLLLTLSILPILILKNGARIVTVSLLSIYVDRALLHGWVHTSGGILFYLMGLFLLIPIIAALRKSEERSDHTRKIASSPVGCAE